MSRFVDVDAFKEWLLENSINEREVEESKQIGIWLDAFCSMQNERSDCEDCIKHGGDWECDRVHCHKGDAISRQAAIDAMCCACGYDCDKSKFVYNAPQDEQVIMCPEHYALSTLPSVQPDIDEFLRNKSPKEHREILHWIAIHYYPRDSKEVLQAVSNMVRPDTKPEPYRGGE